MSSLQHNHEQVSQMHGQQLLHPLSLRHSPVSQPRCLSILQRPDGRLSALLGRQHMYFLFYWLNCRRWMFGGQRMRGSCSGDAKYRKVEGKMCEVQYQLLQRKSCWRGLLVPYWAFGRTVLHHCGRLHLHSHGKWNSFLFILQSIGKLQVYCLTISLYLQWWICLRIRSMRSNLRRRLRDWLKMRRRKPQRRGRMFLDLRSVNILPVLLQLNHLYVLVSVCGPISQHYPHIDSEKRRLSSGNICLSTWTRPFSSQQLRLPKLLFVLVQHFQPLSRRLEL